MKLRVLPLLIVLCAGLGLRPAAGAAVSVSAGIGININAVGDFYAPLQPYGTWVNVGSYGRCFHPTHVMTGWRPYTYGHWEYTDVGWYWVSDEPFGWACFHYGSWVDDPNYGWIWIPGTEWSPAWVTWRESDNYIGWAPCGPNLAVAAPSLFVFVSAGHFCDPIQPNTVIVNNARVINSTRVVNNFRPETRSFDGGQRRMRVNAGPDVARVQHATGRNLSPTPILTAIERTNMKRSGEQPNRERSVNPEQQRQERQSIAPEQQRERGVTTPQQQRERPAATPEKPAVHEPSGAARENRPSTTHEAPAPAPNQSVAPSAPRETPGPSREAPATEKPAIHEPSGATREAPAPSAPHEAPAPSAPQEEHRTLAPQQSHQQTQRAPVEHAPAPTEHAPAQVESHPAPAPQQPHQAPVEQNRGNEHDRRNDNP